MSPRSLVSAATALGLILLAAPGHGQGGAAPPPEPPASSEGAADQAPSAPEERAGPKTAAAGYAYSDTPARSTRAPRRRYRKTGPVVNVSGFEQLPDGGSRLFVQLSEKVPVEERKTRGAITYILKGASPRVWNNTNPLVTVHFNTPVSRARLVPRGKDLWFVVDLRAAAEPAWKLTETPSPGGAMLTVDFPRGDYLHAPARSGGGAGQPSDPPRGPDKGR